MEELRPSERTQSSPHAYNTSGNKYFPKLPKTIASQVKQILNPIPMITYQTTNYYLSEKS